MKTYPAAALIGVLLSTCNPAQGAEVSAATAPVSAPGPQPKLRASAPGMSNPVVQGRCKPLEAASAPATRTAPLGPGTGYIRHARKVALPPLCWAAGAGLKRQDPVGIKGRLRIGIGRAFDPPIVVNRSTTPASEWTVLPNGWRIWSAELTSPGALGVRVHLEALALPAGVRVLVYDPLNPTVPRMPIAAQDLAGEHEAWAQTTFAETVVVECQVPPAVDPATVAFTVSGLSHLYRLPGAKALPGHGSCQDDVTCYPEWAQDAAGVARIEFVDSGTTYLCTGCLLNGSPTNSFVDYFLTANHCVGNQQVASTLELYWFYQTSSCNGPSPALSSVPSTSGGADFLAGAAASDFAFLRLRQAPPDGVYYLGWTRALPSTTETLACIQHPGGSVKRISFGNAVDSDSDFWHVQWTSGDTEDGSSGSPLLNADHQVIGQLYGGTSSCFDTTGIDTFGRLDVTYSAIRQWIDAVSVSEGTYNGLFEDTNGVSPQSSGSFTFTTTATGKFSGKLQLGKTRHSMRGQFDASGSATPTLTPAGQNPLNVVLQLDLSGGTGHVTGTVSSSFGAWTAELAGDRAVFNGKTAIAPQQGHYTLLLPGNHDSTTEPGGDSYGTLSVDTAGRIHLSGLLADGTRISQASTLSTNGLWPLYIPLYNGGGLVLGWIAFNSTATTDLGGEVTWIKPRVPSANYYPAGFALQTSASGSVYTHPGAGEPILSYSAATVVLGGGNLSMDLTNEVVLSATGANNPTNRFRLAFAPSTGTFKGSVQDPASLKPVSFSGVVLQKQGLGAGCWFGANLSGPVLLQQRQ